MHFTLAQLTAAAKVVFDDKEYPEQQLLDASVLLHAARKEGYKVDSRGRVVALCVTADTIWNAMRYHDVTIVW